jgi:hypothetical protein
MFQFNRFLGKYELAQIAERASDFVPMFAGKLPQPAGVPSERVAKLAKSIGGLSF